MPDRFDADDVARLRAALARIARQLDRQTRGASLTRTSASVLATLARRGPLRPGELADIEGVHQTMLSRMVGRLTELGLVERTPDPADARAVLVAVTEAGGELDRRLRAERTRLLAEHLAALSDTDATRLMSALPALEALAAALSPTTSTRSDPPRPPSSAFHPPKQEHHR
ncbi:MarR family winged helix-turn-helix transcriptional regulator [Pseudonocardia sp. CA-107938]|uniref:MarR family winged helix-turn-helix transcriptional regulator n=1 Tax=Pseudonocardia sp. CA-107938 TaxID=3240021 RepID=UPI003D9453F6